MRNIIKQKYPNMDLIYPYSSWLQIIKEFEKFTPVKDVILSVKGKTHDTFSEDDYLEMLSTDIKAMAFDEIIKTFEPIKADFDKHHYILKEIRDPFSNDVLQNVLNLIHKLAG